MLLLAGFIGSSRLALQRGIGPYVAEIELSRLDWLVDKLRAAHAREGSWAFLDRDPRAWHRLQLPDRGERPDRGRPPPPDNGPPPHGGPPPATGAPAPGAPQLDVLPLRHAPPPPPDARGDPRSNADSMYSRLSLVAADGQRLVAGRGGDLEGAVRRAIVDGERTIGYLALEPLQGIATSTDRAFAAQQSRFIAWTGLAGLAVALLLSVAMARRWLRPMKELADAAEAIAAGRRDVAVPIQGDDEFAMLGRSFNAMAAQLDAIEQSRQQWLADVAHELRTPVTGLRAEIEALQDGVRGFDAATANRLHAQVMRLGKLVEDLRLVMHEEVDGHAMVPTRPLQVLLESAELMRARLAQAGLALDGLEQIQAIALARDPVMQGDPQRLGQVFANLLENAARYSHSGGRVLLDAALQGDAAGPWLEIRIDDTPPAPPERDLQRLFERFYRGDASRARSTGGAGLGLAICKAIVLAHGGRIHAEASPLGGLRVVAALPLETP